eukprot:364269-Chlamydomonas_euryale.AAC.8
MRGTGGHVVGEGSSEQVPKPRRSAAGGLAAAVTVGCAVRTGFACAMAYQSRVGGCAGWWWWWCRGSSEQLPKARVGRWAAAVAVKSCNQTLSGAQSVAGEGCKYRSTPWK